MIPVAVSVAHFTFDSEEHYESGLELSVIDYSSGLIRRGLSGFHVLTGIDVGVVGVDMEVLGGEPQSDASDWEDVVEFHLAPLSRAAVIHDYFEAASAVRVALRTSGRLIVRVSARGRDIALDSASMMGETYRLQFWPAKPDSAGAAETPTLVIKAVSEASAFREHSLQPARGDDTDRDAPAGANGPQEQSASDPLRNVSFFAPSVPPGDATWGEFTVGTSEDPARRGRRGRR